MAAHIDPTAEQLQAAFAQLQRPGWPATLTEALTNPVRAALIRGQAVRNRLRAARAAKAQRTAQHQADGATRAGATVPTAHRPPTGADRKRLAAGDRDDD